MLLIDIRSTNASAAEFILDRLKLYLAGRHHHHHTQYSTYFKNFKNPEKLRWRDGERRVEARRDLRLHGWWRQHSFATHNVVSVLPGE